MKKPFKRTYSKLLALVLAFALLFQNSAPVLAAEAGALPEQELQDANDDASTELAEESEASGEDQNTDMDQTETVSPESEEGFHFVPGYIPVDEDYDTESLSVLPDDGSVIEAAFPIPTEARYITAALPPLRNQNPYGTCWAHASIALVEISLLQKGITYTPDFSELHLANFMYRFNGSTQDPLGGMYGDSTALGDPNETILDLGGNLTFSQHTLYNWLGAASESSYPYSNAASVNVYPLPDSAAMDDAAHINNIYRVNIKDDPDGAKALVKALGALGVSYFENGVYYSSKYNSFYNNEKTTTNHAVTLVGWDDNFSRYNFNTTAPGDGAWLIRNSWRSGGTYENSQSHYGYFWMSYYDTSLANTAYAFEASASNDYDYNYQYDGGVISRSFGYRNSSSMANVFTASNPSGKPETLDAVSFEVANTNTTYTVSIYKNLPAYSGSGYAPDKGDLVSTVTGTTSYVGIYQVPIPDEVLLNRGDRFSVVVTLEKSGETPYLTFEGNADYWIVSKGYSEPGQSFYKSGTSRTWTDAGTAGNARIKAYTHNAAPRYYLVFKDSNGTTIKRERVKEDSSYFLTEPDKKPGYRFTGWREKDGTLYTAGSMLDFIRRDYEFTAEYEETLYNIFYDMSQTITVIDEDGNDREIQVSGTHDNITQFSVNIPDITLKDATAGAVDGDFNIIFTGWYDNAGRQGSPVKTIATHSATDDVYLYAGWSQAPLDQYKITLLTREGNVISQELRKLGGKYTIPKNPVTDEKTIPSGYEISKWRDRKTNITYSANDTIENIQRNIYLVAEYAPTSYKIVYVTNQSITVGYTDGSTALIRADGQVPNGDTHYTIESSDLTLVSAEPDARSAVSNLIFEGWYDNPERTGDKVLMIPTGSTGDKTFYANYIQTSPVEKTDDIIARNVLAAGQRETEEISDFYRQAVDMAKEYGSENTVKLVVIVPDTREDSKPAVSKIATVKITKASRTKAGSAVFTAKKYNKNYNSADGTDEVMVIAQHKPNGEKAYLDLGVSITYTIQSPQFPKTETITSLSMLETEMGYVENYIDNMEFLNIISVKSANRKILDVVEENGLHRIYIPENKDKNSGLILNPKSGTARFTVEFGEVDANGKNDPKNNIKYTFSYKVSLPKLADKTGMSVTTNPENPKKIKYKEIKISNMPADISEEDIRVSCDDFEWDNNIKLVNNNKSSWASIKVWSAEKISSPVPITFDVDGDEYTTWVTVK